MFVGGRGGVARDTAGHGARAAQHQVDAGLRGGPAEQLRHYVEGVHEIRIIWDEDDEAAAREWEALAGETLDESSGDEGWEFTTEERQAVTGLLERGT